MVREATARTPLMPLRILRSRNVAGANLIQALSVAGMFGMFFLGALYLQRVLGYDALADRARLPADHARHGRRCRCATPSALMMRFGAARLLLPGLALIAAGLGLFARLPVHGTTCVDVLPAMLLLGTGAGVCFPALMTLAMSGATPADAGLASGLVNTTGQVGGALGLAVLATAGRVRAPARCGGARRGRARPAATTSRSRWPPGWRWPGIAVALLVLRPARQAVSAGAQKSRRIPGMTDFPESHRDLLDAQFATLATLGRDGSPQLTEVWFLHDEGELKLSLNTSRLKTKNLPPPAGVQPVHPRPGQPLPLHGHPRPGAHRARRRLRVRRQGRRQVRRRDLREHDAPGDSRVVVTIEPTNVFAVNMGG